jgi:hypothetical protein
VLQAFPSLVNDRALFLDLVREEYKACRRDTPHVAIDQFSKQFCEFGTSLEQSIIRLLQVEDYFDRHPELLQLVEAYAWPEPGQVVQGFQILEEMGRGALARVYLCREVGVGERVIVVKITRGGNYEASLMGRLDHPNIVPVYSASADDERRVSYICMPYRGRSTLQDLIDHAFDDGVPRSAKAILDVANAWTKPNEGNSSCDNWPKPPHAVTGSYVDGVVRLALEMADALAHAHC